MYQSLINFLPVIIGGEVNLLHGGIIMLIGYACLTAYVCAVFSAQHDEVEIEKDEMFREMYSGYEIAMFQTQNPDGSSTWNAFCEDFAGIVGSGSSKESAIDDLLSNVKKEILFAQNFVDEIDEGNN